MPAPAIHPLTPDRWDDLVDLFGPERGASSGCWCMWWRMQRAEWDSVPRAEKRDRFRAVAMAGPPPGVLAYDDEKAIGWCAIGPRETLPRMNRSRVAGPLDDTEGVWAVNCFYIRAGHRGEGLMLTLLDGALRFAAGEGVRIVEASPIEPVRTDARSRQRCRSTGTARQLNEWPAQREVFARTTHDGERVSANRQREPRSVMLLVLALPFGT